MYWRTDRRLLGIVYRGATGLFWDAQIQLVNPPSLKQTSSLHRLEGNMENYQVCSVQYCAQELCTVQCTHYEQT